MLAVAVALIPLGTAFTFPCVTALLSRVIDPEERGLYMGMQQTYGGAARIIAPLFFGWSFDAIGVSAPFFFSSAITVLISLVDFDRLGGVVHWLLGNLGPVPPAHLAVFAGLTVVGLWLVVGQARPLNLLALGEESAQQLGVDAERLKRRVFVGAALLTSAVVAFVGPIGFVGLIVPQIIRMLVGPDNRVVIPAAVLGGGAFLLLADTVARNVVAPAELSVGVITALCGAPFFVYLLRARAGWPAP